MSEGELGHVTVVPDGPLCPCGNRGCLQTLASGPAILGAVRERLRADPGAVTHLDAPLEALDLEAVERLVALGCAPAREALDHAAGHLGLAAANLLDILNPEMLVLGGTVVRALPSIVPRVEAVIRRRAFPAVTSGLRVVPSLLGRDAVPVGAAVFLIGHVPVVGPPHGRALAAGPRSAAS